MTYAEYFMHIIEIGAHFSAVYVTQLPGISPIFFYAYFRDQNEILRNRTRKIFSWKIPRNWASFYAGLFFGYWETSGWKSFPNFLASEKKIGSDLWNEPGKTFQKDKQGWRMSDSVRDNSAVSPKEKRNVFHVKRRGSHLRGGEYFEITGSEWEKCRLCRAYERELRRGRVTVMAVGRERGRKHSKVQVARSASRPRNVQIPNRPAPREKKSVDDTGAALPPRGLLESFQRFSLISLPAGWERGALSKGSPVKKKSILLFSSASPDSYSPQRLSLCFLPLPFF